MLDRKTILIIDDDELSRTLMKSHLEDEYNIYEFANGRDGIEYISRHCREVSAVILDIYMAVMNGFEFLEKINSKSEWKNIPVIVVSSMDGNETERKALELGAWDFIKKPAEREVTKARLNNAINRSQLSAYIKLKYLTEYDSLTGLYNKDKLFDTVNQMLTYNLDKKFVFIRMDIERYQLINSYFGLNEGDKLLIYISLCLKKLYKDKKLCRFGRIEADIFGVCVEYNESDVLKYINDLRNILSSYNPEYEVVPNIGLYVIEDNFMSVDTIYSRATVASTYSKGNYIKFYTFYTDKMSQAIIKEQEILNDMKGAIENEQFDLYFQPKYSLKTNKPYGAEALVRWFHPQKGMIMPSDFIPVFERNGFISKLDFYVWEKACKYIRSWIDAGRKPFPISVNVSRVNMYNPKIVDIIKGITDKYDISPELLNLELTESAYTDNPVAIKEIILKLQNYGFLIMMDDFGSGYSSLNILKDLSVDVLKVDMRFLSNTDIPGRGDNILASVIRMAKWLKLPVIVEGVETSDQTKFLKSIGCDYVQGFYFASPMPVKDYISLIDSNKEVINEDAIFKNENFDYDMLFDNNPQMKLLFGNNLQPIMIAEFSNDTIDVIRVNEGYYELFNGKNVEEITSVDAISVIIDEHKERVLNAFREVANTKRVSEVEYIRKTGEDSDMWIKLRLQYVQRIGYKDVILGTINDITVQKDIELALDLYKINEKGSKEKDVMLIVDDYRLNRITLRQMFKERFNIIEAENGREALDYVNQNDVDVIILDLVLPYMDGKELLGILKTQEKTKDIPVVVITTDDSKESLTELLNLGVSDYIIKPFIKEIVKKRIENVLVSSNNMNSIKKNSVIANTLTKLIK